MAAEAPLHTGRPRRKDAFANHEAILDAAAVVLNYDMDASLEAIAQQAGLSRRTLYGHFANRDQLLEEMLVRGATRLNRIVQPASGLDPRVEIALYAARIWAEVDNVRVLAHLAVRGPHRDLVARALEPLRRHLRTLCENGVTEGVLRQDIDPGMLARLVEGAVMSVLEEATRTFMPAERAHRLVMLAALGIAGLGWQDANRLVDSIPALRWRENTP